MTRGHEPSCCLIASSHALSARLHPLKTCLASFGALRLDQDTLESLGVTRAESDLQMLLEQVGLVASSSDG